MRPVDPNLMEVLLGRTARQYVAQMSVEPLAPDQAVAHAGVLAAQQWFRAAVEAAIDVYRWWQEHEGKAPDAGEVVAMRLSDVEKMITGRELLDALRASAVTDRPDVRPVWVVPADMLVGLSRAFGLPVIRTEAVDRPTLAIGWEPTRSVLTQRNDDLSTPPG